jgi:hypothetical protein
MRKIAKKLVLAKETVRNLAGRELAAARGGLTQAALARTEVRDQVIDSPYQKAIADSRRIC